MSNRLSWCLALAAAAEVTLPNAAGAAVKSATVENATSKSVWAGVYGSSLEHPFELLKSGCLKPGQAFTATVNENEAKVRAEVKSEANCSGATISDTSDLRKNYAESGSSYRAFVREQNGQYGISF